MTPAEVLTKAADLIEERGWTQGDWARQDGCLCVLGAIYTALGGRIEFGFDRAQIPDWNTLRAPLGRVAHIVTNSDDYGDLARWNDDAETTKDDVVAALRAAAEVAS